MTTKKRFQRRKKMLAVFGLASPFTNGFDRGYELQLLVPSPLGRGFDDGYEFAFGRT